MSTLPIHKSPSFVKASSYISTNSGGEQNIFDHHLSSHANSATTKVINLIYSFIVTLLTSKIVSSRTKHHIWIGVIMGLISYISSRKLLKNHGIKK